MRVEGTIHIRVAGGFARRLAAAPVRRALPIALLVVVLGGCSHTQTLRVVDAQTGEPLGNVWVSQGSSPTAAFTLKTDPSGTVQFQKSGSQYALAKPGYEEARVELKGSMARVRSNSDPQGAEVERYGELVQVPMRRQDAAVGANGPEPDAVTLGILARRSASQDSAVRRSAEAVR